MDGVMDIYNQGEQCSIIVVEIMTTFKCYLKCSTFDPFCIKGCLHFYSTTKLRNSWRIYSPLFWEPHPCTENCTNNTYFLKK